jgi:branched-chain amino acid transport system ATP-binding protein
MSTSVITSPLAAEDIVLRFGGIVALDGVSIAADAGEIHGVIGPNGAGKTSLLDVLSGITPPTEGRVMLAGHDVTRKRAVGRARLGLRRTFQRQQLFGWLSVEDNLLVPLEWHGGGGGILADLVAAPTRRRHERERRERVEELLDLFSLRDARKEPAGTIPIGLARLLEMARALIDRPRVVLMDEPTSGLDAHETIKVGQAIEDACATDGCAVVLVEHDVPFVMRHSAQVTVLHLGQVLAHGTPDAIREIPEVRDAYLGASLDELECLEAQLEDELRETS